MRAWRARVVGLALVAAWAAPTRAEESGTGVTALVVAALPADDHVDVMFIDQPATPDAPRVRCATRVAATPAAIRAALLDSAHYQALVPSLIKSDRRPGAGAPVVDWELEVPLFNLSGKLRLRDGDDGITFELFDGDFAPGRLIFTATARPGGGATLVLDAVLDVKHSSWLLRHFLKSSPAGEPAALAAAAYVALIAVALRAEHPSDRLAWRPAQASAPPPDWRPDPEPFSAGAPATLTGRGVVVLVARQPNERLAGVAAAAQLAAAPLAVAAGFADPAVWRAFPGWSKVRVRRGAAGLDAEVRDSLPLVDFDATWVAEPGPGRRWRASEGAVTGARLGWQFFPAGAAATVAALLLYPRLEATGSVARRFIAAEPLLEEGLSLALAFADVAAVKAAVAPH